MKHIQVFDAPQPDVRPYSESGKNRYRLNEDYVFILKLDDGECVGFEIPSGSMYDGASVPRFFMWLTGFERDGIHRAAALIHDFMYKKAGRIIDVNGNPFYYSRFNSDRVFLSAMEHHGIKSWHGRLAYLAVRGVGWIYSRF